jgi:RecG-like helicase
MQLTDPITVLSGVGPKTAAALADLKITTVKSLLFYFPFRYDDLKSRPLAELVDQEKALFKGTVISPPVISRFGPHKIRLSVRLLIDQVAVIVSFSINRGLKTSLFLMKKSLFMASGI